MRHWAGRLALALALTAAVAARAEESDPVAEWTVNFGVSRQEFRDVNENDAAVALAQYARTVGAEYGVAVHIVVLDGPHATRDALERREVDLVNIPPTELLDLDEDDVEGPLLSSVSTGSPHQRYVLLVRADGPVRSIAELRGRTVMRSDDLRSSMASIWLDVLLHDNGLGSSEALGKLETARKPAQAILPVFFGKYDACVTTRSAWEVMGELNPQVRTQLRPLAESEPLMTGLALFRRGIAPALKSRVFELIGTSKHSPAFQQVMMLFGITNVVAQPDSAFDATRQLLAAYRRMGGDPRASRAPGHAPPHNAARRP